MVSRSGGGLYEQGMSGSWNMDNHAIPKEQIAHVDQEERELRGVYYIVIITLDPKSPERGGIEGEGSNTSST